MKVIWIAHHYDWSGFAIFTDELAAYRYAVAHSIDVDKTTEGAMITKDSVGDFHFSEERE